MAQARETPLTLTDLSQFRVTVQGDAELCAEELFEQYLLSDPVMTHVSEGGDELVKLHSTILGPLSAGVFRLNVKNGLFLRLPEEAVWDMTTSLLTPDEIEAAIAIAKVVGRGTVTQAALDSQLVRGVRTIEFEYPRSRYSMTDQVQALGYGEIRVEFRPNESLSEVLSFQPIEYTCWFSSKGDKTNKPDAVRIFAEGSKDKAFQAEDVEFASGSSAELKSELKSH